MKRNSFLWRLDRKKTLIIYFLRNYKSIIGENSFYPEKEHKPKTQIFRDLFLHLLKYGEIDYTYFVLGLDVKGTNYSDYLSFRQFMVRRDRLNMVRRDVQNNAEPSNYACLLRDKALFSVVASSWGFPIVKDLAKMVNGELVESEYDSMEELLNAYHHLFIKPIDGQKGENVFGVDLIDGEVYVDGERSSIAEAESWVKNLSKARDLLVQLKIVQHPDIGVFHKESVNTLRVVTINNLHSSNPEDVVLVGSELRVGCGGNHTDNVSAGGLKIGVKEDGTLTKLGFYDKEHGTKNTAHPDSKILFEGYTVPFYNESIQVCKEFHSKLKGIHLIGWDIAITEEGPLFVEGNESCGTDFQVMFGPMKEFYDKYLPYSTEGDKYVLRTYTM